MEALTSERAPHASLFATTRWSMVLATRESNSPQATVALETLCRAYWYPVYSYVRRQGHTPEDAQDLTQEFFARLLAKRYIARADPGKGKFRSFLLVGLRNFLCDERDKARCLKRGGGKAIIPLDGQSAEARFWLERTDGATPEREFERRWAAALLERAAGRLREEYLAAGKGDLFERLAEFRWDAAGQRPYGAVAEELGVSEGAVRSTIHRLRERHQQLVREEISHTVADRAEVDEEIRYLLQVLAD